jgi:hypothetical protein
MVTPWETGMCNFAALGKTQQSAITCILDRHSRTVALLVAAVSDFSRRAVRLATTDCRSNSGAQSSAKGG